MKIVITSDTHGKHDQLPVGLNGDVLIHCGDFCDGFYQNKEDIKRIDRWFGEQSFHYILCVGGNHDYVAQTHNPKERLFQNATYLTDSGVTIDGIHFYGAPWIPTLDRWAYYLPDDQLKSKWNSIPDNTNVLITHTPPWYILDTPTDSSCHCGCAHLAARIADLKHLQVHCFGHIHANYGRTTRDGVTYINASAVNSNLDVVNPPFVMCL